jgi:hypothetical protein
MVDVRRAPGQETGRSVTGPRRMAIPDGSVVGLVVFLIAVTWFLAHQGRGTTFFYDEWTVWASRFGAAPSQWLTPINGHLSAVPIRALQQHRNVGRLVEGRQDHRKAVPARRHSTCSARLAT